MVFLAGLGKRLDYFTVTIGGRVSIQDRRLNRDSPLGSNRFCSFFYVSHHGVAVSKIGISNIEAEANVAWNTVDGARKDVAHSDRGN